MRVRSGCDVLFRNLGISQNNHTSDKLYVNKVTGLLWKHSAEKSQNADINDCRQALEIEVIR